MRTTLATRKKQTFSTKSNQIEIESKTKRKKIKQDDDASSSREQSKAKRSEIIEFMMELFRFHFLPIFQLLFNNFIFKL